jgi:predicted membrane-bound spermidine synthase
MAEGAMYHHMVAFHLIVDMFLVTSLFVVVLVLSPLLLQRRRQGRITRARAPFLVIFFSLGAGYVIVQLSVLQHFFLLLGNPILTFAITLSIMLAFTGVGSWLARNVASSSLKKFIIVTAGGAAILQVVLILVIPDLVYWGQGIPTYKKLLIVAAVLGVLAVPMGMLFPSSLRLADWRGLDMTPWSWGMNGIGSVLGSVGSTIISLNFGIQITSIVGVAFYLLVALGGVKILDSDTNLPIENNQP